MCAARPTNPLTGRYEGSVLFAQTTKAFDEITLPSEMAKFLRGQPQTQVFIIGQTDNKGTLDYNVRLSDAVPMQW